MFRSCKTLICPSNPIFQEANFRIFLNPIALTLLLNRLVLCESKTSRIENRVRIGSTVILRNSLTQEQLTLTIVQGEEACPAQGIISFSSPLGSELLGLRCGDIAKISTPTEQINWEVMTVNHGMTKE